MTDRCKHEDEFLAGKGLTNAQRTRPSGAVPAGRRMRARMS